MPCSKAFCWSASLDVGTRFVAGAKFLAGCACTPLAMLPLFKLTECALSLRAPRDLLCSSARNYADELDTIAFG